MAQKVLGLNHPESEQLEQAVAAAMKTAKTQQSTSLDGVALSENKTVRLPALSDTAIQNLTDEVLANLSEGAAPADRDLASFLMQRQLREE